MSRPGAAVARPQAPAMLATAGELRAWSRRQRQAGRRVALVPTMGALHAGHEALMEAAAAAAGAVAASIFVNPAQFGPGEDYQRYPRTLEADLALCARAGAHAAYVPRAGEVYATDHSTWVEEGALALPMEGEARPGHFRGVLTVVLKLLHAAEPDLAFFGQKDIQQALLIRRMVRDLDLPVEMRVVPTVRESDGLALSSRNAYLTPRQRAAAPYLARALSVCARLLAAGETDPAVVRHAGLEMLAGVEDLAVEYLEVAALDSLQAPPAVEGPVVVAAAVRLGTTRLIDNVIHPDAALAALARGETTP